MERAGHAAGDDAEPLRHARLEAQDDAGFDGTGFIIVKGFVLAFAVTLPLGDHGNARFAGRRIAVPYEQHGAVAVRGADDARGLYGHVGSVKADTDCRVNVGDSGQRQLGQVQRGRRARTEDDVLAGDIAPVGGAEGKARGQLAVGKVVGLALKGEAAGGPGEHASAAVRHLGAGDDVELRAGNGRKRLHLVTLEQRGKAAEQTGNFLHRVAADAQADYAVGKVRLRSIRHPVINGMLLHKSPHR